MYWYSEKDIVARLKEIVFHAKTHINQNSNSLKQRLGRGWTISNKFNKPTIYISASSCLKEEQNACK